MGHLHRLARATRSRLKAQQAVSRARALGTSAGLSIFFLVVYGGCLWITAQRRNVGVFYFAWERAIPFVPFMILPYLSIDLFFVAAPFLFSNRRELDVFVRRVVAAIVIAGIFFLFVPLRFAFPGPTVAGWLGVLFDWFRAMDAPFNLCPSLHAALLILLVDAYRRDLRGWGRRAVMSWFILIAASPLLTHQHHLIDVLCGFALGAACLFLFRENFNLDSAGRGS